jgi:hypothetical protein
MDETRAQRIAAVHRELAELEAINAAVADGLRMRITRTGGPSVVYSIRIGLTKTGGCEVADAVEQVAAAVEELRALVASSPMRAGFD